MAFTVSISLGRETTTLPDIVVVKTYLIEQILETDTATQLSRGENTSRSTLQEPFIGTNGTLSNTDTAGWTLINGTRWTLDNNQASFTGTGSAAEKARCLIPMSRELYTVRALIARWRLNSATDVSMGVMIGQDETLDDIGYAAFITKTATVNRIQLWGDRNALVIIDDVVANEGDFLSVAFQRQSTTKIRIVVSLNRTTHIEYVGFDDRQDRVYFGLHGYLAGTADAELKIDSLYSGLWFLPRSGFVPAARSAGSGRSLASGRRERGL